MKGPLYNVEEFIARSGSPVEAPAPTTPPGKFAITKKRLMLAIVIGAVVVPGLLWAFAPRLGPAAVSPIITELKSKPVLVLKAPAAVTPVEAKKPAPKKKQAPEQRWFW